VIRSKTGRGDLTADFSEMAAGSVAVLQAKLAGVGGNYREGCGASAYRAGAKRWVQRSLRVLLSLILGVVGR